MTLKGILWRPGVNGLGVGNMWINRLLPYRKRFGMAARVHDRYYDMEEGSPQLRRAADWTFLMDMGCECGGRSEWPYVMAVIYYVAVRLFGWLFYRYSRDSKESIDSRDSIDSKGEEARQ